MMHIVKRQGHREHFDERKIYATCYAACLNAHVEKQQVEKICNAVTKDVKMWVKSKKDVTSHHIFRQVIRALKKHNKDAAFMYETHRDIA